MTSDSRALLNLQIPRCGLSCFPVTVEQIIGLALTLIVMAVGLVGSVIPGLPGTPLVLVAAIGHRLYFGQAGSVSNPVLVCLIVFTVFSLVLDYLAGMYGARRMGATWRGILGAGIGGVVGLFFGIPGILLGPFIGATLLELIGGHEFSRAAKAGLGATLGLIAGAIGKGAVCVAMIGLFALNVIWRAWS